MISLRTAMLGAFAVAAVAGAIASTRVASDRGDAKAEREAWALLAEAADLCRPRDRLESGPGWAARLATGQEALDIVRELRATVGSTKVRSSLTGGLRRSRPRCGESLALLAAGVTGVAGDDRNRPLGPPASPELLGSLDGSGRLERHALIVPHLERLMAAASRGGKADGQLELSSRTPVSTPDLVQVGSESVARSSAPKSARPQDKEIQRPAIVVGAGTREHRKRRARFSRVFSRAASELREGRRNLQREIDRMSLAESRAACQAFGSVLENLDSGLETKAPSRGLEMRIARMLTLYRRGVEECVEGHSVAAFVSLSEGDREWGTVASAAARMQPLRRRSRSTSGARP